MVWGSKLRGEVATVAGGRSTDTEFLPVRVTDRARDTVAADGQLEVVLRNGRRVLVSGEFGAERLARLLEIAEGGA